MQRPKPRTNGPPFIGARSTSQEWTTDIREMLEGLALLEYGKRIGPPLRQICETGASYGLQRLDASASPALLALMSRAARVSLKRQLRRSLERVTRPSLELSLDSFRQASYSLHHKIDIAQSDQVEHRFLGKRPCDRLIPLFEMFPALAGLWFTLILLWCDSTTELLARFKADRRTLSREFFRDRPLEKITNLRSGLSDPHNGGRTVALLEFKDLAIIYKPRPGNGEQEWYEFVRWFNRGSFKPKLHAAHVLTRKGYCWMERIRAEKPQAGALPRLFDRVGATIAAAYLLRAADLHRDNIIVAGEHPVLVDAETLWHVSRRTRNQSAGERLFETGFLSPSRERRGLRYRSSVLPALLATAATRLTREEIENAIVRGFTRAWRSIFNRGSSGRFQFRMLKRRHIYRSTAKYDRIRRASIQPAALRSTAKRDQLIARLCRDGSLPTPIVDREIEALSRFDIPYFTHKPVMPGLDEKTFFFQPRDLAESLRRAVGKH
jgi:lantibiotic modifying enzyme